MIETIVLENVSKTFISPYKTVNALINVNLKAEKGKTIVIFGPSGSGKTTLLSLMGGIELPSQGEIYYDNLKITTTSHGDRTFIRKENFSFIFQNFALINGLTVVENLDHHLLIHGIKNPEERQKRIYDLLKELNLTNRSDYFPYELSGGEKQRIALARAMSINPSFIFADEPTGRLDMDNAIITLDLLINCVQERKSCLIIFTHDSRIDFLRKNIDLYLLEYGTLQILN